MILRWILSFWWPNVLMYMNFMCCLTRRVVLRVLSWLLRWEGIVEACSWPIPCRPMAGGIGMMDPSKNGKTLKSTCPLPNSDLRWYRNWILKCTRRFYRHWGIRKRPRRTVIGICSYSAPKDISERFNWSPTISSSKTESLSYNAQCSSFQA